MKGTPYHATDTLPCAMGAEAKPSARCGFGVIRGSSGNADVYLTSPGLEVTSPGAIRRVLKLTGTTVTTPDPGVRLKANKQGDEWSVAIDDRERYVIPEAVILGG